MTLTSHTKSIPSNIKRCNNFEKFLKRLSIVTIGPNNSTLRYTSKKNENVCLHQSGSNPNVNKMCHIHTIEDSLAVKKKEGSTDVCCNMDEP